MKSSTSLLILAPLFGTVLALGAANVLRSAEARGAEAGYWDDDEVDYVRRMVASTYVDPVSEKQSQELFYAALDGYVKSLPDEYDDFITPDEYRRWKDDTAGHYAGIGVKIEAEARGLRLIGVLPGGPAAQAGLKIGEVVTEVDGRPLAGADLKRDDTLRSLKGDKDTVVHAKVWIPPPAGAPAGTEGTVRDATVVRAEIRPPTVFARRLAKDQKVGYLRISEFTEATKGDVDRELDAMVAGGARAVVVDLRGNGGGVLNATVHIADRFVRSGDIVRMTGRAEGTTRTEPAHEKGTIPDSVGLVVLVDGHSASASEVFAGCIQDHRRGVLLGTRTYGKFLVQNITEIPGKGAALKLTTARYQTPLGRSYQRPAKDTKSAPAGLLPDIAVELSADDAAKFEKQMSDADESVWGSPPQHPELKDWIDPQLQRALDLIDGNLLLQEVRGGGKGNG